MRVLVIFFKCSISHKLLNLNYYKLVYFYKVLNIIKSLVEKNKKYILTDLLQKITQAYAY